MKPKATAFARALTDVPLEEQEENAMRPLAEQLPNEYRTVNKPVRFLRAFGTLASVALAATTFICTASAAVQALQRPTCESLFHRETGPALAAVSEIEFDRLQDAWGRLRDDHTFGNSPHPNDLKTVLDLVERMLMAQGALVQRITLPSGPALEILAAAEIPGWGRMAASLKDKYRVRLLFAPIPLIKEESNALYHARSRSVLLSIVSAWQGRANSSGLHEIRHAALLVKTETKLSANARMRLSTTIFNSFIATNPALPDVSLSPGAKEYRHFMDLSELVTHAQDLIRAANFIRREDSNDARKFAARKLEVMRECAANSRAMETFLLELLQDTEQKQINFSGPILGKSGPEPNSGFFHFESGTEIQLRMKSSGAVDISLFANDRDAEITVRSPLITSALIQSLWGNDQIAARNAKIQVANVLTEWVAKLQALNRAVEPSLPSQNFNATTSVREELDAPLRQPWRALAPFLN
jgi:hypothetical protein